MRGWVYSWNCLNVETGNKDDDFISKAFWKGKAHVFYRHTPSQLLQELPGYWCESYRHQETAYTSRARLSFCKQEVTWSQVLLRSCLSCWTWQCFLARTVDYLGSGPHCHLLFPIHNMKHKWIEGPWNSAQAWNTVPKHMGFGGILRRGGAGRKPVDWKGTFLSSLWRGHCWIQAP